MRFVLEPVAYMKGCIDQAVVEVAEAEIEAETGAETEAETEAEAVDSGRLDL